MSNMAVELYYNFAELNKVFQEFSDRQTPSLRVLDTAYEKTRDNSGASCIRV